jgi:predicted nucleotidyltransferase
MNLLETISGSKLRAKLLGWLFSHPDERFYARQLTALLQEDSTNLSRELARLEKAGLLNRVIEGRQKYYQANRQSPIFDELHRLVIKTSGIADTLRAALMSVAEQIRVAFIYGSFAAGTENRHSDIDLMVIGDISPEELTVPLDIAEARLAREINPALYTPAEFRDKLDEGHHFLKTVTGAEKLFLIGDEDEFGRLAGRGQTKSTYDKPSGNSPLNDRI